MRKIFLKYHLKWAKEKINFFLSNVNLPNNSFILDLGGQSGAYMERFKNYFQKNYKIIIADLDEKALEEARQKEEQFTREKISFLNEVRKGREQFDNEKIALLHEANKKETDLMNEINHQKNIVKWYVNTYEARSILGVLKEKLKGKKKI